MAYKFGGRSMGLEAGRFALRGLQWLGVTSRMLDRSAVDPSCFAPLSARDRSLLPGLRAALAHHPAWLEELSVMEEGGVKADIEALYSAVGFGGLRALLAGRVLRREALA